jgi:hypothetical protein
LFFIPLGNTMYFVQEESPEMMFLMRITSSFNPLRIQNQHISQKNHTGEEGGKLSKQTGKWRIQNLVNSLSFPQPSCA